MNWQLRVFAIRLVVAVLGFCRLGLTTPLPVSAPTSAGAVSVLQAPAEEPFENGSPRASVAAYLALCRAGSYELAARYLDIPSTQKAQGPLLAKRLKAVLDRHAWIEMEALSAQEKGRLDDGLPHAYEAIAKIPVGAGRFESVRLFKRSAIASDGPSWVFSRSTVEHIDNWYSRLELRWALERLPQWMQRSGPRELLIWQWMILPFLMLLAGTLGSIVSTVVRGILAKVAGCTKTTWDDAVLLKLGGPLTLVFAIILFYWSVPWLGLYAPALAFVQSLVRGGAYFTAFWVVSRLIDVWGSTVLESPWAHEHAAAKSLIPIGVRLGKIVVLVIAVVAFVSAMGYPAASLLAGLGVGGLAVALAAQKTVENLFGAFTLGFDQPFRVGDFVKVEDFMGHVESIGLRSTKIRTLDRTLITIPNGKLSEMRLESFAARDRIRFTCNLGLVYGTTAAQLSEVTSGIETLLLRHPKIWQESIVVKFKELGESSLNIEIMAWFQTKDYAEFQGIRQQMLLEIMGVVEEAKSAIAFPTRTVHLADSR